MISNPVITDFTAGELSPKFEGRFDLGVYQKGMKTLNNWAPISQGGITLRPGTKYIGATKNSGQVRLIPFIINETVSYLLEVGTEYIRFWQNGVLIESGGTPVEVTTAYTSVSQIFEIQYCQVYNAIYFVHRSYAPQVLTWSGGDSFTFGGVSFIGNSGELPFQATNDYPGCVTLWNGRMVYASSINEPQAIWASQPFDYGNITYYDTVQYTREQLRDPSYDFTGDTDGSADITNISDTDIEEMKVGDRVQGDGIPENSNFTFTGDTTDGSSEITSIASSDIDNMEIGDGIQGDGIPSGSVVETKDSGAGTITVNNQATATAATVSLTLNSDKSPKITAVNTNSITLFKTATATAAGVSLTRKWNDPTDPETEEVTTTKDIIGAGHAFKIEIASEMNDKIMWIASGTDLVIGTESSEWILYRGATAQSQSARLQTRFGSAPLQGFMVNDSMIFVQGSKKRIREYHYYNETQSYRSPDLNFFADHILSPSIVEFDYMNEPEPSVYFVLSDGTMAVLLYNKLYSVQAWYTVEMQSSAEIETVGILPGTGHDEVYVVVKRGSNRYLEKFDQSFSGYHVDAGIQTVKSGATASGLGHLEGETVSIVAGMIVYTDTVSSGSVSLSADIADGETLNIGLPFTAEAKTLRLGRQTRKARIGNPSFRLLNSYTFKVGFTNNSDYLEQANISEVTTGDIEVPFRGEWTKDSWITIIQDSPLQSTILCIVAEVYQ